MELKEGLVLIMLLIGSYAAPRPEGQDMSIFFEHVDPDARIVGGTPAVQERNTHVVALTTGSWLRSFFCAGSLISTRTVISAAHCIAHAFTGNSLTSTLRGTIGTLSWNQGGSLISFQRNVSHPNYLSSTIKNDIGLLITSSEVVPSNAVSFIPLNYDFQEAGVPVRVAGWGRTSTNGPSSSALLEVSLTTIDGEECAQQVAIIGPSIGMIPPPVEPHIELCTFHAPNFGTCNGDSGSALVREEDGTQVGVVSWGLPCARGAPDMFVRISAFKDFIEQNMQ